jgi:peptidoglycan hydrolase-like protein with peptidoglycan-binding domain
MILNMTWSGLRCSFVGIVLAVTGMTAEAAVQRMGIAPGVYNIAANAASNVAAFCFDLTRDSPSASTTFSEVLTDPGKAFVRIGGERMSLDEAISEKKVEIKGMQPTLAEIVQRANDPEILSHYRPEQRRALKNLATEWNNLSDEEKAEAESALASQFATIGDHTKLEILNHTNQPISLEVDDSTIFGQTGETADNLPANLLIQGGGQDKLQKQVWEETTSRYQSLLRDAGFLNDTIDGKLGDKTEEALLEFQTASGLEVTGQIDKTTEDALARAAENQKAIAELNRTNQHGFLTAIVHSVSASGHSFYRLSFGQGRARYVNSMDQLRQALSEAARGDGATRAFLIPEGFSSDAQEALSVSVKNQNRFQPEKLNIQVADLHGLPIKEDPVFGGRVTDLITDDTEPIVQTIRSQEFYSKPVAFKLESGERLSVTITARTKELIAQLIEHIRTVISNLRAAINGASPTNLHQLRPVDIVNIALLDLQHDLNISTKELRRRVEVEMGGVQVVLYQRRLKERFIE